MSYFAKIDDNNKVVEVIVADRLYMESGEVGDPQKWVECSEDGSIRARFPGKDWIYDPIKDEFYPPKPAQYPSWIWGYDPIAKIHQWMPPIPIPGDPLRGNQHLLWDEANQQWIENTNQATWVMPKVEEAPEFVYDKVLDKMVENPIFDMLNIPNPYKNKQ